MMNDSLYQNTQQAWTSLHGPFITPKEYEKVPVFGGKEEEEDDDFYDNEFEEKAQKPKENEGKPLKISDLRFLKL